MAYSVSPIALKRFAEQKLRCLSLEEGQGAFAFTYTGSTCSHGGIPFEAEILVDLERSGEQWRLRDFRVRGEGEGLEKCCVPGLDHLPGLVQKSGTLGQALEQILERDEVAIPAGCFCREPQFFHKLFLTLQVVRYWLEQQGGTQSA